MNASSNHWYVAITFRKEWAIKEKLTAMGIDHFIPVKEVVKEVDGRRVSREQLVIPGYVFIHTDEKTSHRLTQELALGMKYLKMRNTFQPVIVPDKQMQDFIYLVTMPEDTTLWVSPDLKPGDRVRVARGDFQGIEGELIRVAGHKRVVVRLLNFLAVATTYIPSSFLERLPEEPTLR